MSQLMKCYQNRSCIRHFLASIILLGYNLFITHHTGQGASSDYHLVKEILDDKLARHPDGAFFLFFQGRFLFVQVNTCMIIVVGFLYHTYIEITTVAVGYKDLFMIIMQNFEIFET